MSDESDSSEQIVDFSSDDETKTSKDNKEKDLFEMDIDELREKKEETERRLKDVVSELKTSISHKNYISPDYNKKIDSIFSYYEKNYQKSTTFKFRPNPVISKPNGFGRAKLELDTLEKNRIPLQQQQKAEIQSRIEDLKHQEGTQKQKSRF